MADAMFMYGVVAGIFAFLAGILFVSRARRYRSGWEPDAMTGSEGRESSEG
ncbi:MAG TPA: hypothetical protein VF172_00595 [Nitrososphaera sp.]|jgi:hypothetical protein